MLISVNHDDFLYKMLRTTQKVKDESFYAVVALKLIFSNHMCNRNIVHDEMLTGSWMHWSNAIYKLKATK